MADLKFVSAITLLLVVLLGEFPALCNGENLDAGIDLPYSVQDFVDGVDRKIDDSVDRIKDFFQSAKRSAGHRVRRSWWSDNAPWIVPLVPLLLKRDDSSPASPFSETSNGTVPITEESLEAVKDSIDFLETLANTASNAIESKKNL